MSIKYFIIINIMKIICLILIVFSSLVQTKIQYPKCECGKAKIPKRIKERQRIAYEIFRFKTLQVNYLGRII